MSATAPDAGFRPNPLSDPGAFGLTLLASLDWSASPGRQSVTAVWSRIADGALLFGQTDRHLANGPGAPAFDGHEAQDLTRLSTANFAVLTDNVAQILVARSRLSDHLVPAVAEFWKSLMPHLTAMFEREAAPDPVTVLSDPAFFALDLLASITWVDGDRERAVTAAWRDLSTGSVRLGLFYDRAPFHTDAPFEDFTLDRLMVLGTENLGWFTGHLQERAEQAAGRGWAPAERIANDINRFYRAVLPAIAEALPKDDEK